MNKAWPRISARSAQWLDGRAHGWLGRLAAAAQEALSFNSTIMAAALAYFALFSLFPLILVSISIASWAYLSGHIFLFGAYVNRSYYRLKQQQKRQALLLVPVGEADAGL